MFEKKVSRKEFHEKTQRIRNDLDYEIRTVQGGVNILQKKLDSLLQFLEVELEWKPTVESGFSVKKKDA